MMSPRVTVYVMRPSASVATAIRTSPLGEATSTPATVTTDELESQPNAAKHARKRTTLPTHEFLPMHASGAEGMGAH